MQEISKEIKKKIYYYENLLREVNKEYARLKDKPGSLEVSRTSKYTQYYITQNRSRKYVKKKNISEAKMLAQRDYDKEFLGFINGEINKLNQLQAHTCASGIGKTYNGLCQGRKALVNKHYVSDEEYVKKWLSVKYEGKIMPEMSTDYVTDNGEYVKSKSEVLIANRLKKLGIPYRYEYPLFLNGVTVYPDFTLLDIKNRREVILEHFGMMDDPEYVQTVVFKIKSYEKNGFYQGQNIIFSFENAKNPLSINELEKLVLSIIEQ